MIPVGADAVLVEVDDAVAAWSLASWARAGGVTATEVVPALRTVLFDGVDAATLPDELAGWTPGVATAPGDLVRVPTIYDGPDLADVAELWGCSVDEAVARHTGLELVSVCCGFAPGFAYLAGLPAAWAVPRLATPRPRVAAGSVGLAADLCGVYPSASPGGWRILGRTYLRLWDASAEPPALLAPGTRVRFEVAR